MSTLTERRLESAGLGMIPSNGLTNAWREIAAWAGSHRDIKFFNERLMPENCRLPRSLDANMLLFCRLVRHSDSWHKRVVPDEAVRESLADACGDRDLCGWYREPFYLKPGGKCMREDRRDYGDYCVTSKSEEVYLVMMGQEIGWKLVAEVGGVKMQVDVARIPRESKVVVTLTMPVDELTLSKMFALDWTRNFLHPRNVGPAVGIYTKGSDSWTQGVVQAAGSYEWGRVHFVVNSDEAIEAFRAAVESQLRAAGVPDDLTVTLE